MANVKKAQTAEDLEKQAEELMKQAKLIKVQETVEKKAIIPLLRAAAAKNFEGVDSVTLVQQIKDAYASAK
jgi:hypothetical protein